MRALPIAAAIVVMALVGGCSPKAPPPDEPPAATETPPASVATTTPSAPVALEIKDASGAQLTGDVDKGKRVFAQCQSCHALEAGVNRVGPTLHAIVGRHSGSVEGFRYSDANKNSGEVWTEQELYEYLENPRAKIPGTTMAFAGVRDSQQRADLIAFLKEKAK